jgi:outer membrane protein assembly factor BamD|tara:strand:+ start:888 stop:1730 length:843 start_codon:yes stop_codon:yes gene_type:complete
MKDYPKYILIIFILFLVSCKNETKKEVSVIQETSIDLQMIQAYKEGLENLELGDALAAAKKFNEAEILFPQSNWASRASLMSAYSYYSQEYFVNAVGELERFLETYPNHERTSYAYYLLGICYYDQIVDEKRDLKVIEDAKKNFEKVINDYPQSDFALDSEYKLELIEEILASKEMYLAKYYIEREKWIPAINRYKNVLENYERTIFIEEALHRLVELHYKIGMIDESKKYASLLGYNYQSSKWYEESYKIFNKNYSKKLKIKKNKKKFITLEKIKSLLK